MKKIQLCFDMDGTLANLYGYSNWLSLIRNNQTEPYTHCETLGDFKTIVNILNKLKNKNIIEVVIISWSSMNGTTDYNKKVKKAKREWLKKNGFPYDKLHVRKYGYNKKYLAKPNAILFDDNKEVRDNWSIGKAYTEKEILTILKQLENNIIQ